MTTEEPLVNNGERLYYKNLAHGFLRQSKIEETKKNDEENFTMEFRFQPSINKTENDKYSNVQSKFMRQSAPTQKLTEEDKNKKTIEPKTEEEIKNMINRLHSESKKLKENKEKLYKDQTKEECPFTPTINVQGKADPKYFMMRLEKWNKKMEEKLKTEGEQNKLNVDKNTGQKLFQPKVDDPVARKLKRENEDVHFDLYKKGLEHIDYRKKIMETDTRDDLEQIENKKLEKITKLKEERDRYKKEKQERLEKELNERSLKVKAEKENMQKILKERTQKEKKEDNKNKQGKKDKKGEKDTKQIKDKNEKNTKALKNIFQIQTGVIISQQKLKNKKIPLSASQRANTETKKKKSFKGTKDNKNNILKKIPIKKDFINERSKSQSQKNKNEKISKEKKTKTITTESRNKNKIIIGNEKKIKSSKNDKKKEKIDNNNIKKQGDKSKEGIKYNVVSMGNKYKSIKKGKI